MIILFERKGIYMSEKCLSNLAVLMDLLNISTVDLSKAINMERTSISKWRHGTNRIMVDMPYFEEIVNYFVQKNESLGNELLEDFFEGIYPVKKRLHKDYLKRCIRNYILNIPDSKMPFPKNDIYFNVTKLNGADGRMSMFTSFLETAEKSPTPCTIKVFETDQLEWVSCNMQYCVTLYQKLKNVLNLGHKVEFVFQFVENYSIKQILHQMFTELSFHDNLSIFIYSTKPNRPSISSIYVLSEQKAIVGYWFDDDLEEMTSCLFNNKQYAEIQEKIFEKYKATSTPIPASIKLPELGKMFRCINASNKRNEAYYYSGKALSLATMSKELFDEVVDSNNFTNEQKKICNEYYNVFRSNIENSGDHEMSGFYYVLDEIIALLDYPTITNYVLSAITGKLVEMSREQYLRHFKDTAEILLKDNRYRVLLHYTVASTPVPISHPKYIWCKNESWVILINTDDVSGKTKFMFNDDPHVSRMFQLSFYNIYSKVSNQNKDNAYVAKIFMKIANGETI